MRPTTTHECSCGVTGLAEATAGFPELGLASLTAAPVRNRDGDLLGTSLMYTFKCPSWTETEVTLVAAIAGTLAALVARLVAEEDAQVAKEGAIRALGLALDLRDGETKGHTDRVTDLAIRIGTAGRLNDDQIAALRWDSYGYPTKLAGEDIPLLARIFAHCDVYDAPISERPYKRAWSHDEAIREIRQHAGTQFDPTLVDVFLAMEFAETTEQSLAADYLLPITANHVQSFDADRIALRPSPIVSAGSPPGKLAGGSG